MIEETWPRSSPSKSRGSSTDMSRPEFEPGPPRWEASTPECHSKCYSELLDVSAQQVENARDIIILFFLTWLPGVDDGINTVKIVSDKNSGNPAWPLSATRRTPAVRDSKKDSLSSAMSVRWSLLALSMLSRFTRGLMVEPFSFLHSNLNFCLFNSWWVVRIPAAC